MSDNSPIILVAAGTNGAGKSSILQPLIEAKGGAYFNPDHYSKDLVKAGYARDEADAQAWQTGYDQLVYSIDNHQNFAFETTLGGSSITLELLRALALGRRVAIFYVGLENVELHIARVAQRVKRGGHSIPEAKIRERFDGSRANLLRFMGTKADLRIWDNSTQTPDGAPRPVEIFRADKGKIIIPKDLDITTTAKWAQPLVAKALELKDAKRAPKT